MSNTPKMFLSIVPAEYWDEMAPFFLRACERRDSGLSLKVLEGQVRSKQAVMFAVVADDQNIAGGTFERRAAEDRSQIVITCLAGDDMEEWLPVLMKGLDSLAKAWGCDQIVCVGRPGWAKVLKRFDYRRASVEMIKEII